MIFCLYKPSLLFRRLPPQQNCLRNQKRSRYSKISRVFSSNWESSVSAPTLKFHAIHLRDSYPIINLFMQDNTYLPRNFATLGSLELQPPVFTDYILIKKISLIRKLGQESLRILNYSFCAQLCLWSTVAGLFLPSSFQMVFR